MDLSNETLRAIIAAYGGFALSDAELELVRPELQAYIEAAEQLRDLDLSAVFSGRLLHVAE